LALQGLMNGKRGGRRSPETSDSIAIRSSGGSGAGTKALNGSPDVETVK
jgi:hypothetical protein